jgi:predicted secreted protein
MSRACWGRSVMGWVTGIVLYVIVWWVTLFAVLPLWVTPSEPGDLGHAAGAPQRPRLLLKAAITTMVAALIWLVIYFLVRSPWFSFREP